MLRPRKEAPTYPVIIPIKTNRGYGETRVIGPTRVTFATAAMFAAGEPLRFAMSLRGHGATTLEVFCSGSVRAVATDGELFVIDASIEQTDIRLAEGEGD